MEDGMAASGPTSRRLLAGVWTGITLQVAGQVIDLRWHATHPGFERAADQVQAHWLIWLGVLVTVVVAAVGARHVPSSWYSGYRLLLLAGLAYALSSAWHFWEHAQLRDPAAPHVLVALGKAAILAGAISATVVSRRRRVTSPGR
jgi:hypothetical protein